MKETKQNRRKEKKGNDGRRKDEMKGKREGKKKATWKNEEWKDDWIKEKSRIENIKRAGRNKRRNE